MIERNSININVPNLGIKCNVYFHKKIELVISFDNISDFCIL